MNHYENFKNKMCWRDRETMQYREPLEAGRCTRQRKVDEGSFTVLRAFLQESCAGVTVRLLRDHKQHKDCCRAAPKSNFIFCNFTRKGCGLAGGQELLPLTIQQIRKRLTGHARC